MKRFNSRARGSNRAESTAPDLTTAMRVGFVLAVHCVAGLAVAGDAVARDPQDVPVWNFANDSTSADLALPAVMDASGVDGEAGTIVTDDDGSSGYLISDAGDSPFPTRADDCCPRWTGQVDALFLFMANVPSRTVYVDDITELPVLNVRDAVAEVSIAPRYAIMWHRDACRALEVNYFQVSPFRGTTRADAPPGVTFSSENLGGVPFNDVVTAGLQSTARIKSLEFNLRRRFEGPVTWIAGFRWVEWNQTLLMADRFVDAVTADTGLDFYGTSTGNNLYGGQLGADVMLWNRGERLRVNGLAKAGVFYNHQAYQRTNILSDSVGLAAATAASIDTTAFVGEVALVGEYWLTNWLAWRAGYTVFWLGGIAAPANQLALSDFTNDPPTTGVSPYSSALLHGVTTGLEARW